MADDRNTITLSKPIKVGNDKTGFMTVSALTIDPDFKAGWLRGAPTTPTWLIAVVRSLLSEIPAGTTDPTKLDDKALFAKVPSPSGEEMSQMVPWLLHMAAKASGQSDDVIDQLSLVDLFALLLRLLPGMGALPNFQMTPASGSGTSPGSSIGAPATSTA
jgi:hypothetical protein